MSQDPMKEIGEGDMKKRLEGLSGVSHVRVDPDNPDGDFCVYEESGTMFEVARETLKKAWQMEDEILFNRLRAHASE